MLSKLNIRDQDTPIEKVDQRGIATHLSTIWSQLDSISFSATSWSSSLDVDNDKEKKRKEKEKKKGEKYAWALELVSLHKEGLAHVAMYKL